MMRRKISVFMSGILIILSLPLLPGCKKKEKTVLVSDYGAYSSIVFNIPEKEGFEAHLSSVLKDAENTCISVVYSHLDQEGVLTDQHTDIYTVDDDGKRIYTLELVGEQPPCVVLENEYAFLGYSIEEVEKNRDSDIDLQRTAVFLDKKKGDLVRTIQTDFQPHSITAISDGFVILGASTIARYSKDGALVKVLKLDFSCYVDGECFYEDNGRFYVIEEKELGELIYHEVDFDTGVCPALAQSEDIGVQGANVEGKYFFNPDGEYRVDLANMKVDFLADWNCIDIRPPKKYLDTPSKKYKLDDKRFAISYEYRDRTAEVLIFHYDPSIDRSNYEVIKIGGYGVYNDPVLQWAVYSFNTSNEDCRVILEDYGQRFDAYLPEERRRATLALTQYFNEGNTPDIFYGTRFDYAYMGRNGMVIDMSSYMKANENTLPIMTEAANRLMIDGNGACYQVFSGYIMYGYSVQESVLKEVQDTSIFSLYQYAKENEILYSATASSDIVDTTIRYNFADLWGIYDGERKITQEEITQLISIVLALPISKTPYNSILQWLTGLIV